MLPHLPIVDDAQGTQGGRCSGHCCRAFYLPFGPEELVEAVRHEIACRNYEQRLRGSEGAEELGDDPRMTTDANGNGRLTDILQIADMVRYLGWRPSLLALGDAVPDPRASHHHYTCSNLTPEGNCGIYETRPGMCRRFPANDRCCYADCTWAKVAQAGVV